jgi:hypothetical protein
MAGIDKWIDHWAVARRYATEEQKKAVISSIISEALDRVAHAYFGLEMNGVDIQTVSVLEYSRGEYFLVALHTDKTQIVNDLIKEIGRQQLEISRLNAELQAQKSTQHEPTGVQ